VNEAVRFGIENRYSVPADREHLGMPDLVRLAIGKPQLEWLKRSPVKPLPDGIFVHPSASRE
jgi:hypothetical protein